MNPSNLIPGDSLLHHSLGSGELNALIGGIETWGEWDGKARQDLKAVHVEAIYDNLRICKMNPPASCLYWKSDAPWPIMTGWRLDLSALNAKNIPQYPGLDPNFVLNWQAEVNSHLGEKYGWSSIANAVGIGLLTHVWPWAGNKLLGMPTFARPDCSVWLTKRINNSVRKTYAVLAFDLFDDNINDGEVRPADFPTSRFLKPIV